MSRERRIRRWVRGSIAAVLAIVGLFWPDPDKGVWLLGLVVVTLVVLKLAVPRGWDLQAKRATLAMVALIVVASVANDVLPWWLPAVVVLLLAPLPFFVGITEDLLHDEKASDRSLIGWMVWAKVRRVLRVSIALLAWLITWRASGDLSAALLLAPAAIATAAGWPSIALAVVAISTPFVGGSSSWWAIGTLSVVVAVSHLRARPPRRSVGLPISAATTGHPVLRQRIRGIDRRLRRSDWIGAELRCEPLLRLPGPGTTSVGLRLARAHLEQNDLQGVLDALATAWSEDDLPVRAAVRRLQGEVLTRTAQPDAALGALTEARALLPGDPDHQARVALAAAEALVQAERFSEASYQAGIAAEWFRHRRDLVERFRAARLLASSFWQLDELDRAIEVIDETLAIVMSVRWLRQYLDSTGVGRDDEELVFSGESVLLVEWTRLQVLELQLKLDPRLGSSDADETRDDDILHDLEMYSIMLDMGGAGLERAEVDLLSAEVLASRGKPKDALTATLGAVAELDEIRHGLRAQTDRSAWSATFNRALAMALEFAVASDDDVRVAELIELARVQAYPLVGTGQGQEEVALQAPPTVRVRGRASVARGSDFSAGGRWVPPVDLERAAAEAAGPGAWWLSFWHDGSTLTWALVPPSGDVQHGRLRGDRYAELRRALDELDQNLPIALDDETDADVDLRLFGAAYRRIPDDEARLSAALGDLLLPQRLRRELKARRQAGRTPLRLAIAPDPLLAHVPWALLAVDDRGPVSPATVRLTEVATWALAPSATLLVLAAGRRGVESNAPLRLAVLDPADVPELPAARALAAHLDGVRVLGGRHWMSDPATPAAVFEALASAGPDSCVLFGCHAVRGDDRRPSSSALVLASSDPTARAEPLTAAALFASPVPRDRFPAQISLQACDTSDLASAAGGEWLTLAPAFLAAGARIVGTTQFPLVDVASDEGPSRLIQDLCAGVDLAEALRGEQLEGLARWRSHDGSALPPLEDTPLAWAAHAVCSTGRGGHLSTAVDPLRVSSSFIRILERAAKNGRGPDRTVTTAHVLSEYIDLDTELLTGSLVHELAGASLLEFLPRILRAKRAPGPDGGVRPSAELLDAVRRAGSRAATSTGWLQTEHIVQAVLDGPSTPGRRLLSALRLRNRGALRQTIRGNLREAQLRTPSEGGDVPAELRGFLDEITQAAQTDVMGPTAERGATGRGSEVERGSAK